MGIEAEHPVNYLRICFNAFYYLAIFPFRFYFNSVTNHFEIVQHPVQTVLCVLNFGIGVTYYIFLVREVTDDITSKTDPSIYFKLTSIASSFIFFFTVFISIWHRSEYFLSAFNHLQGLEFTFQRKNGKKARYLTTLVLSTMFFYQILHLLKYIQQNQWNLWQTLEALKSQGLKILFLEKLSEMFPENIPFTFLFAITGFIFLISYNLFSTFGEILLLNCAFCLGDLVDEFGQSVKHSDEPNMKVLEKYEALRKVSDSLNKAVGVSIFGEVLASLPYFVTNFVEFIHPPNVFIFILHLVEFGNIFGFVVLAANVHRKANAIEEWILDHENISHLSFHEVNILLHQISSKTIAFNGSGFFKINSGFLGSFVSLLLTFSVILIQFKTCR